MPYIQLPGGRDLEIPEGMDYDTAVGLAKRQFPEAFGIQQKHGFYEAAKAGAREGIGSAVKGIGSLAGSQNLTAAGDAMMAPDQTPGAYRETTGDDVSSGFEKGVLPGMSAWTAKNITEPLGGMVGRYALPTAAGAGAAMLAPEAGLFGLGAAGTAALARGAGFIAADLPSETGENIQRQQEVAPEAPVSNARAVMSGLAQAALLPVFGALGGRATQYFKMMGSDMAAVTKQVMSGQMSQEAAVATLNSTAKNLLVKTGEAAAVGAPMMVGTEALRTGQSGQDVLGPEAMGRYGESIKAAAAFAPIGGVMGGLGRRGQVKQIEKAGKQWSSAEEQARAAGGDRDTYEQKWNDALASPTDTTTTLPLEAPEQPKGKNVYKGAVEPEAPAEGVIDKSLFNTLGIPNKGKGSELRAYEGMALDDPRLADLHAQLSDIQENIGAKGTPKWAERPEAVTRIQWALDRIKPKEEPQQAGFSFDNQAKPEAPAMADAGTMHDMFTGEKKAVDMSKPESAPAETTTEYNAKHDALYAEFQKANEEYQKTGDDAKLNTILAQARNELGPMNEKLNQASTQKMFDKRGKPTKGATAYEPERAAPDSGAGDVAPVQGLQRSGDGSIGVVPDAVGANIPADERAPVGKEPEQATLKAAKSSTDEVPEVTDKTAAIAWEDARDNSPNFPSYDELHPDAQAALRTKMELNGGELNGKGFRSVVATHKDALRSERIAKEVKGELDPDAFMYRKGDEVPTVAHAKSEAEATVNNTIRGWKNAPQVEVKQLHELSPDDRARATKEGAQGWYKDGKVTIVHEHNANIAEVKATLFHEALGHYGLRSKFGAELRSMMEKMYDTNPEARRMADVYLKDNVGVSKAQAIEEVLAERQIKGQVPQGILGKIAAFIRDFARRAGMKLDYTDNDIAAILRQAHKEVVEGGKKDWTPTAESAMLRKKEKPFSDSVPAGTKITLEHEGPNGEIIESTVKARATMREAERRVNILNALKECLGA